MQFITFEKWLELNPTPSPKIAPSAEARADTRVLVVMSMSAIPATGRVS
jgi:hypothetical protein